MIKRQVSGRDSRDRIVTLVKATRKHALMCFIEKEDGASHVRGAQKTLTAKGLFCPRYTDRGRGKIDKELPRSCLDVPWPSLGIEKTPAYSPKA